jgi:hypothetical protein
MAVDPLGLSIYINLKKNEGQEGETVLFLE